MMGLFGGRRDRSRRERNPQLWLVDRWDDFSKIEVNTMQAEITARKMPDWPEAMRNVAETYGSFLADALPPPEGGARGAGGGAVGRDDDLRGVFLALAAQAERGTTGDPGVRGAAADSTRVILFRIRKGAREMVDILDRIAAARGEAPGALGTSVAALQAAGLAPATAKDAMAIRKFWELGANRVLMQTVLQLDGDIVSRIAGDRPDRNEALMALHTASIGQSIAYWNMVLTLVGRAVGGVLSRGRGGGSASGDG